MLPHAHADMTHRALQGLLSPRALKAVVSANVWVDAPWNQLGHDEFHFDNNAFGPSRSYIAQQRGLIRPALERGDAPGSWRAFGRLVHTAQDFYSHSNYVDLWLTCQPNGRLPAPSDIDPLDESLIENPSLRSGKAYTPFGFLSFVPGIRRLVIPLLPSDSHARMNLDSAARGPMFAYAFEAGVKRTTYEFDVVAGELLGPLLMQFRGFAVPAGRE